MVIQTRTDKDGDIPLAPVQDMVHNSHSSAHRQWRGTWKLCISPTWGGSTASTGCRRICLLCFFGYVLNLCCKPNQQPLCPPSGLSDVAWIRIDTLEIKACCCVHLDSKARFIPLKTGVCPCQCQLRWIESLPWGQMRKRGPLGSFLVVVWGFPKSWGGPN